MTPITVVAGQLINAAVPCNGCTRCCENDLVRLLPSDDPAQYQTMPHPLMPGKLALAHAPNGSCIYLTPSGCGIHGRAPQMCREMDCRRIATEITWTQARKLGRRGVLPMKVWRRGRELLNATEAKLLPGAGGIT